MLHTLNINENQDVEVCFDENNRTKILNSFKSKRSFKKEELEELEKNLEKLDNIDCVLDGKIDEVEVSEDVIDEAYGDIHKVGTYNDGYNDGIEHIRKYKDDMKITNGLLLQKLDHLAYGYGNKEPLTKDEIKKIKELLDYEYTDGMI
jgi:hypothetical protein